MFFHGYSSVGQGDPRLYIAGYTREKFEADGRTRDAVLRRLLVIGEAASHLSPETLSRFPELPFRKMIGMRNRVVHDYGAIDVEIVWDTISIHVPVLCRALSALFPE